MPLRTSAYYREPADKRTGGDAFYSSVPIPRQPEAGRRLHHWLPIIVSATNETSSTASTASSSPPRTPPDVLLALPSCCSLKYTLPAKLPVPQRANSNRSSVIFGIQPAPGISTRLGQTSWLSPTAIAMLTALETESPFDYRARAASVVPTGREAELNDPDMCPRHGAINGVCRVVVRDCV
jgi:hypothetical protein